VINGNAGGETVNSPEMRDCRKLLSPRLKEQCEDKGGSLELGAGVIPAIIVSMTGLSRAA
jgi:hypothetical protein